MSFAFAMIRRDQIMFSVPMPSSILQKRCDIFVDNPRPQIVFRPWLNGELVWHIQYSSYWTEEYWSWVITPGGYGPPPSYKLPLDKVHALQPGSLIPGPDSTNLIFMDNGDCFSLNATSIGAYRTTEGKLDTPEDWKRMHNAGGHPFGTTVVPYRRANHVIITEDKYAKWALRSYAHLYPNAPLEKYGQLLSAEWDNMHKHAFIVVDIPKTIKTLRERNRMIEAEREKNNEEEKK